MTDNLARDEEPLQSAEPPRLLPRTRGIQSSSMTWRVKNVQSTAIDVVRIKVKQLAERRQALLHSITNQPSDNRPSGKTENSQIGDPR